MNSQYKKTEKIVICLVFKKSYIQKAHEIIHNKSTINNETKKGEYGGGMGDGERGENFHEKQKPQKA